MRRAENADELECLYFELITSFKNENELLKTLLGEDWKNTNKKQRAKMYFIRFKLTNKEQNAFFIKKMEELKQCLENLPIATDLDGFA